MFGFAKDQQLEALTSEITKLSREVASLRGEKQAKGETLVLMDEINKLKRQVNDLKIEKSGLEEAHARQERELTHKVGLEKKRQEMELAATKREVAVEIREKNLTAERDAFKTDQAFRDGQFNKQVDYLQSLMSKILDRLPEITVETGGSARSKSKGE
jgi:hypothetical protein